MALNEVQFLALAELYASRLVDEMDTRTLAQFAFDSIIENLPKTGEDLITEIANIYDEEVLNELLDSTGISPSEYYGK